MAIQAARSAPLMKFSSVDPEAWLGLPVGAGTTPSTWSCCIMTAAGAAGAYGTAYFFREGEWGSRIWDLMTAYMYVPIPIVIFSIWSLAFLALKALKIAAQRKSLGISFVSHDSGFVINDSSADAVIDAIDRAVDDPARFMYLARCRAVLRMIRNLGRISDADDILNSRGDQEESSMDSGYTILRGFVWAIPVLGFIGTVLGLTESMARFGKAMEAAGADVAQITARLKTVLEGLDTAFITTAEGLIAVLVIYLLQSFVRRADEKLADDIRAECSNAIVARLRIRREGD